MEVEIVHESIDYDELFARLSKELVNQSLPYVQAEVMGVLQPHRITGETEASIKIRPVSGTQQSFRIFAEGEGDSKRFVKEQKGQAGEVYTAVEWAHVLEYTAVPFMRLGAQRAKKKVRALIKPIFGKTMRGVISMKKRRRM
jgi:hypothetical protein